MAYQPMEELLPKSGYSVYKLIKLIANRSMELADEKPKLVEAHSNENLATTAMREVAAGYVVLDEVADQFDPANLPEESDQDESDEE